MGQDDVNNIGTVRSCCLGNECGNQVLLLTRLFELQSESVYIRWDWFACSSRRGVCDEIACHNDETILKKKLSIKLIKRCQLRGPRGSCEPKADLVCG